MSIGFDTGNTAFMLISTSLVMLMTPGLAFFYGGLAGKKGVLTIMMQSFISLGITTIMWYTFGFSLCFSGDVYGVIGNLDMIFLRGVTTETLYSVTNNIPLIVFVAYQMMFAIITPALITGAFIERVRFKAFLIFQVLWLILVYFPFAHMIWGGGILQQLGVLDFAGGIVVHATAGMAALASVLYVGKRKETGINPHNIPLLAIGTALLWFGWYGFNAGSQLKVDGITAFAFINTDIAASFSAMTWLIIEWKKEGKPKLVGFLTGAVGGLATITPAAGYVTPGAAAIIGITAGIVCFMAVEFKNRMEWDDALDVWGVHGIGGITGVVMLALFANKSMNPNGADGLFRGGIEFFTIEILAVAFVSIYAFIFTSAMLRLINMITPVVVTEEEQAIGVDEALHGEVAYLKY